MLESKWRQQFPGSQLSVVKEWQQQRTDVEIRWTWSKLGQGITREVLSWKEIFSKYFALFDCAEISNGKSFQITKKKKNWNSIGIGTHCGQSRKLGMSGTGRICRRHGCRITSGSLISLTLRFRCGNGRWYFYLWHGSDGWFRRPRRRCNLIETARFPFRFRRGIVGWKKKKFRKVRQTCSIKQTLSFKKWLLLTISFWIARIIIARILFKLIHDVNVTDNTMSAHYEFRFRIPLMIRYVKSRLKPNPLLTFC